MKRTMCKSIVLFAICLLLLSIFAVPAFAWPPPCPGCCDWNGWECNGNDFNCDQTNCKKCSDCHCVSHCNPDTKFCCNGRCCDNGTECCNDRGGDYQGYCCEPDQTCCQGRCCDSVTAFCCNGACCRVGRECCTDSDSPYCCWEGHTCCNGYCCKTSNCLECDGQGHCISTCDPNTEACCDGECYNITTQKCCTDGENKWVCDKDEICCDGTCCDRDTETCCDDGTCEPKCEDGEPTGQCDTSYNEECIGCTVIPYQCSDFISRIYTGNEVRYCTGGCPGDCVLMPWPMNAVECYVECECKWGTTLDYSFCGAGEEGVACTDILIAMWCTPCVKNDEECVIEYAYPTACQ